MTLNLKRNFSLKTKLTLLPLGASVLLLFLVFVFWNLMRSEEKLLDHIEQATLTKVAKLLALSKKIVSTSGSGSGRGGNPDDLFRRIRSRVTSLFGQKK